MDFASVRFFLPANRPRVNNGPVYLFAFLHRDLPFFEVRVTQEVLVGAGHDEPGLFDGVNECQRKARSTPSRHELRHDLVLIQRGRYVGIGVKEEGIIGAGIAAEPVAECLGLLCKSLVDLATTPGEARAVRSTHVIAEDAVIVVDATLGTDARAGRAALVGASTNAA